MHSEATFQPFQIVCKYLCNAPRSTHDKKSCGFPPTSFFIASSYGFGILQDPPISYSMESVAYLIWLVETILLWTSFSEDAINRVPTDSLEFSLRGLLPMQFGWVNNPIQC